MVEVASWPREAAAPEAASGPREAVAGAEAVKRSPANKAVLVAACINSLCSLTVAASLCAFFPRVVARQAAGTAFDAGLVFAAYPLAGALASPCVPALSRRVPRPAIVYFGIACTIFALLGFARASTIRTWVLWRLAQGAAGALVDVPMTGMLLTYTSDVAEDTGILEAVAGLAYTAAPAIGGALYEAFGDRATFEVLAACQAVSLVVVPCVLRGVHSKEWAGFRGGAVSAVDEAPAARPKDAAQSAWLYLFRMPAVSIGMATFAWSTAALGFYDAANAQHEHATLSFTPVDVGLTFLVPALAYAAVSPFAGTTIRAYGARTPLVVGCVLWVLACLSWGPLPLKTPHVRAYVWLMLALNSALIGPAIALMFQAPLPLARHFIDAHRARGVGPPSQAVDDTLAALQNAANSIGAVVGPLVGGFLVDRAPQLHEPGCRLHDGAKCHSGFLWGTVLFTLGFAAFVPLILTLVPSDSPNRKREDDEATDARLEPLLREATLI